MRELWFMLGYYLSVLAVVFFGCALTESFIGIWTIPIGICCGVAWAMLYLFGVGKFVEFS